jgi:hypothetical protein
MLSTTIVMKLLNRDWAMRIWKYHALLRLQKPLIRD